MRWSVVCLALLWMPLAGCLSDGGEAPVGRDRDALGLTPVASYALPDDVTDMDHVLQADDRSTRGIWIHDDIAYLSGGEGLRILDIGDPQQPVLLADEVPDSERSRDVDILEHPDGRIYAVVAQGGPLNLFDVTDPRAPFLVSSVPEEEIGQAHNVAVVPNSTIVYLSNSVSRDTQADLAAGSTGGFDIIDYADPADPQVTTYRFPSTITTPAGLPHPVASVSCHDFRFVAERELAVCPAVSQAYIWDVSDPLQPHILQVIQVDGNNLFHAAWFAHGGDMLVLGDEFDGVIVGTPACTAPVAVPTAGLWFYDISDLATPTPVGYYALPYDAVGASLAAIAASGDAEDRVYCSAHFGDIFDDRDMMVIAWYGAGTVLIDFSDLADIRTVAQFLPDTPAFTWDAWVHNGHVFTGDQARGVDILRLT